MKRLLLSLIAALLMLCLSGCSTLGLEGGGRELHPGHPGHEVH